MPIRFLAHFAAAVAFLFCLTAQPVECQGICITRGCYNSTQCGQACICASVGPGPEGVCVLR